MSFFRRVRWCATGRVVAALCGGAGAALAGQPKGEATQPDEPLPAPRAVGPAVDDPVASLLAGPAEPIDLASALELAGVQNPEILRAREQVVEAVARRQLAAAQILPNLNVGTNYHDHDGNLPQS